MPGVVLFYGYPFEGKFQERPPSFEALLGRLDELREQYGPRLGIPYSVDLLRTEGAVPDDPTTVERLSVGLGDDDGWMLFWFPAEDAQAPLSAVGDESAEGSVVFWFGDWSLLSRKYLVPRSAALEAIRAWFEEGVLSDVVAWTDQLYAPE